MQYFVFSDAEGAKTGYVGGMSSLSGNSKVWTALDNAHLSEKKKQLCKTMCRRTLVAVSRHCLGFFLLVLQISFCLRGLFFFFFLLKLMFILFMSL